MASRFFAFIIWAAVAASVAYWGLRWLAPHVGVPASATSVKLGGQLQSDFRQLFAGNSPTTDTPAIDASVASQLLARLRIIGAVGAGQAGGVALLSVDGKPPRAIRVGDVIDGDMVLLSINQRQADIGPAGGPTLASMDLPRLAPPTTGTLPPAGGLSISPAPRAAVAPSEPPPTPSADMVMPPDDTQPPPAPSGDA